MHINETIYLFGVMLGNSKIYKNIIKYYKNLICNKK